MATAVIINPVRPWTARALGRSPLTRATDRVEAWAIVVAFALLLAAALPALAAGQLGYEARSRAVAADAASRHPVEATAQGPSWAQPTGSEMPDAGFTVNVAWSAQHGTREATAQVDQPVKAGDRVQIWLTDQGRVTTPPPSETDARIVRFGTAAVSWLLLAALVVGAFALLRHRLNRLRDRAWDRGWRELVDNGGGSATFKP